MSRNYRAAALAAMLAELACVAPVSRERTFLMDRGWLPLGRAAETGIEGWGKIIDGGSVIVDQPVALEMEGWQA
jgi:hypothetical protein